MNLRIKVQGIRKRDQFAMKPPILNAIHNLPLSKKLIGLIFISTFLSLIVPVCVLVHRENQQLKKNTIDRYQDYALLFAPRLAPALHSKSNKLANSILNELSQIPDNRILNASVFDSALEPFARFGKELVEHPQIVQDSLTTNLHIEPTYVEIVQPIFYQQQQKGIIYLRVYYASNKENLSHYLYIAAAFFIAPLIICIMISPAVQIFITKPLTRLTQTARHITEKKDYSIRSPEYSTAEIGTLIHAFNTMLNQIEERGRSLESERKRAEDFSTELKKLNDTLESRIRERTLELEITNSDLEREIKERSIISAALKNSEKRFRGLIESTQIGVSITNEERQVEWANDAYCTMFGYQREELIQKSWELFIPQATQVKFKLIHEGLIEGTTDNSVGRYEMLKKDNSTITIDATGTPFKGNDQKSKIAWFVVDATTHEKAEKALRAALDQEKQLSELKDRFVSMVSHDLRTPLSVITFAADMLGNDLEILSQEERHEFINDIRKSTNNIKDLMEDVLLMGKMNAGKVEIENTEVHLEEFLNHAVREIELSHPNKARIHLNIANLADKANLDPKVFRQIIINLLSNAVKYSPELSIVVCDVKREDHELLISVTDNGIGIPEQDIEHLFTPFHRAQNVGHTVGTGLGLAIVKKSVELLDGTIHCQSALDEGTTFNISLPAFKKHRYQQRISKN
ncbi:MAG: ATP-binding protein [Verrucomicrobiota bacterium]